MRLRTTLPALVATLLASCIISKVAAAPRPIDDEIDLIDQFWNVPNIPLLSEAGLETRPSSQGTGPSQPMYASALSAHHGQGTHLSDHFQPGVQAGHPVNQHQENPGRSYTFGHNHNEIHPSANPPSGPGFQHHPTQQPQQASPSLAWAHDNSWNRDLQYSEQPAANYRSYEPAELASSTANPRSGQGFLQDQAFWPQQLRPGPMPVHGDSWQRPSGWNQVSENIQQLAPNYPTGKPGEASSPSTRSPAALSSPTLASYDWMQYETTRSPLGANDAPFAHKDSGVHSSRGAAKADAKTEPKLVFDSGSKERPEGGFQFKDQWWLRPTGEMRERLLERLKGMIEEVADSEAVKQLTTNLIWESPPNSGFEAFDSKKGLISRMHLASNEGDITDQWLQLVSSVKYSIAFEGMRVCLQRDAARSKNSAFSVFRVVAFHAGNLEADKIYFGQLRVPSELATGKWLSTQASLNPPAPNPVAANPHPRPSPDDTGAQH